MLPMSKINKAEGENKQRTQFWLLPFLLAIALGWVNISHAAAQSSACNTVINLSARLDHYFTSIFLFLVSDVVTVQKYLSF